MNNWHGKHPTPWDMFLGFNRASGKNLNWFWNNWFFSNNYLDFAIQKVVPSATQYVVTLQNIGGYVAPVDIVLTFADGTTQTFHQTPAIWQVNQKQATLKLPVRKKGRSVRLEDGFIWTRTSTIIPGKPSEFIGHAFIWKSARRFIRYFLFSPITLVGLCFK